jgi:hypothetical protein
MARTDADMVKAKLLRNYDSRNNPSLSTFINSATIMTDRIETRADDNDITVTVAELLEIETLLAAFYYCLADKTKSFKGTEGAQATYDGKTGMGFKANPYGQAALEMDPTGYLASLSSVTAGASTSRTVGAHWLGKTRSERIDYEDRN